MGVVPLHFEESYPENERAEATGKPTLRGVVLVTAVALAVTALWLLFFLALIPALIS